ncbi:MAG TPA: ATP-binding protein [Kofleriaceae bacterium]|nr:ATP-binding protein [Kofleriaceae bacterium]
MEGDAANLSREFRTLVMSIRGPLEDELAERGALPAGRSDRLRAVHRNMMRMLQFVNAMLDIRGLDGGARDAAEGAPRVDRGAETMVIPRLRDGAERTAELERANEELEAFSYSVSHDLRGPLRAVDGFSQILLSEHADALDPHGRDLLEQIRGNASRMSAIVDDLLSLAHVGRSELRREAVDPSVIARRVVANLRLGEPSRSVEVSLATGLAATCDGRLVTIALENLFANAWKFTRKRSQGQIVFEREDARVFAVRDNGAGFDMEYSEHLFEPFQRLHSNNDFEGTGIGLAIVRRVIERHGGKVWAQGVVDAGATVRFTLEP